MARGAIGKVYAGSGECADWLYPARNNVHFITSVLGSCLIDSFDSSYSHLHSSNDMPNDQRPVTGLALTASFPVFDSHVLWLDKVIISPTVDPVDHGAR